MQDKLIELEKEVMKMLLDGNNEVLKSLRIQYEDAQIVNRQLSQKGFFTNFNINRDEQRLEGKKSFQLGDVVGQLNNVKDGVGFVLFIKDGAITMLEGFTYGNENWPETILNYELCYLNGNLRDIEKIKAKWE